MRKSSRDMAKTGVGPDCRNRRTSGRKIAVIVALGLTAGLAGCADQFSDEAMGLSRSVSFQDRYPIEVRRSTRTLEVRVSRRLSGMNSAQKAKVRHFLYEFAERGAGKLRVSRPRGTPNQLTAGMAAAQIRHAIDRAGVPREKVILSDYRPAKRRSNAPVVLSFIRYSTKTQTCGDWSENLAATYQNRPYSNLGCSTQSNLAAMVANPRDLVKPRRMTPPDAIRRDTTFEGYRKGEVTSAQKSEDEKAAVSQVAK